MILVIGSLFEIAEPDENGVVVSNNSTSIECKNVLLRSEGLDQKMVGLKDLIAVSMPDAVLIVDKKKAQKVGSAVVQLKKEGISQATNSTKDHRPWGWFEVIEISTNYQVKKIVVNSGAALSLQSHEHRSEHWVVVKGKAEVTLENDIKTLASGASIYIPLGAKHRLANKDTDNWF